MVQDLIGALLVDFKSPFLAVRPETALMRLLVAATLGAVIGVERQVNSNSAGLRTHMMVAIAACLFTLIAHEIIATPYDSQVQLTGDPLRLIEAVTSGVAFLAAGSIITSGGRVTGLTTGAGMWMAGAIGLSCGTGRLPLAIMATVLAVIVLWLLRRVSHWLDPTPLDRDA